MQKSPFTFDQLFDTFFHLPTLLAIAAISVIMVWQIYSIGLNLGDGFVRVSSSRGSLILSWQDGCCELDW